MNFSQLGIPPGTVPLVRVYPWPKKLMGKHPGCVEIHELCPECFHSGCVIVGFRTAKNWKWGSGLDYREEANDDERTD